MLAIIFDLCIIILVGVVGQEEDETVYFTFIATGNKNMEKDFYFWENVL